MRIRRALLSAVLVLSWVGGPGRVLAQTDYAPPDPVLPLPLYNTRPEGGGFFNGIGGFTLYRISNSLNSQIVYKPAPPARPDQILYNVRVVSVPASLYERLKETYPLEGKKPIQCGERELQALMAAVQSDPEASVLSAPQMMALDYLTARVEIGQARQFVTGVRLVSKEGKPSSEPVTSDVFTGLEMTLTGHLKNEGKSVEVNLNITGTRVERVETVPIKLPIGAKGEEVTQHVQCPHVARNTLARTVTMPAGQTVVLPGWWEEGKTAEVALPVLGQVALLNGLFVATPKESQRILVFVTARTLR